MHLFSPVQQPLPAHRLIGAGHEAELPVQYEAAMQFVGSAAMHCVLDGA